MKTPARQHGFILLLVLMVLAIAGTILAASARRSCSLALRSSQEQEALQVRWGNISCRDSVLLVAENILQQQCKQVGPTSFAVREVDLGGLHFRLVLGDEQAKANVNALVQARGQDSLPATLAKLQENQHVALAVDLRPSLPDANDLNRAQAYWNLEQVFLVRHPRDLLSPGLEAEGVSSKVTCWGGRQVNILRASPEVMRESLAGVLDESAVHTIVQERQNSPDASMLSLAKLLKLPGDKLVNFKRYACDSSNCHSLWVLAQGTSRSWYYFAVLGAADENSGTDIHFAW